MYDKYVKFVMISSRFFWWQALWTVDFLDQKYGRRKIYFHVQGLIQSKKVSDFKPPLM